MTQFSYLLNLARVLTLSQLRERYVGTWAGLLWAFVNPIILIGVFWVVFAQGFRVPTSGDRPFLLLLVCALVPWLTFSEAVSYAANSIMSRAYLVRKIAFPMELLPLTNVLAALVVHVVLVAFAIVIAAWYGRWPSATLLTLPIYTFGLAMLASGLGFALSALGVAFRDVLQGLSVALNLLFWATPIVWSADMMPAAFQWFVDFNPVSYLVEGYRRAILGETYPAPTWRQAAVFWTSASVLLALGLTTFRRLRPNFADLL
jgi:ABC-type polysaccharide/polyol phosphate export permease